MLDFTLYSTDENYQREERHLFTFYSHNMNKKVSMRAISITMETIFPLKVLVINKSEDTQQKSVIAHFRL